MAGDRSTGTRPGGLFIVAARADHVRSGARTGGGAAAGGAASEDDRFWRGPIYVNRKDRALLVPKRWGLGWTLNFGNPRAWLVITVLLVLTVAVPVLSAVAGLR